MTNESLEIGVIGLGRMGGNLSLQAMEKGIRVVGYSRSGPPDDLQAAGIIAAKSLDDFHTILSKPRRVFVYVPAGPTVDQIIDGLTSTLEPGDIIIDGGNSYWGDSIRRHATLAKKGFKLVDAGTSGGVDGARHGACFMVGGDVEAVAAVEPILVRLAVPGGYLHAGPSGSGHFVKLVHNGIEFGMLQAIGEGVDMITHYRDQLDLGRVLDCWCNGSVIRSWLVQLMRDVLEEEGNLDSVPAYVEDTGEVNWLVDDALHMEVPVPVIAQSVMQLLASRDSRKNWARAIAMMRHGFGQHPFGSDEGIKKERKEGRIGVYAQQ